MVPSSATFQNLLGVPQQPLYFPILNTMFKSFLFLSFACWLCSTPALAQQPYFPDTAWQSRKPAELKLDATALDSAVAFAQRNEATIDRDLRIANMRSYANEPGYKILGPMKQRGGPAGLIIKGGYIVAQWGDPGRVDMTFSATKSYLSTVAGLAVDQRLIGSIEEPVNRYVWDNTFEGNHNSKITWRHLLDQTSDWSGCQFEVCDWSDRPPRTGGIDDWKARKLLEPGSTYEYNDARVNVLAYSLLQVWRKPLPQVLKEKIMDPIGASTTWRWYGYDNSFVNMDGQMVQSVSGGGHFGGGLFINTWDQARFGLLFLRKGKWKGKQLVSEQWVKMAHEPSKANPSYSLLWWTNAAEELKGVSKNIWFAAGFGGNYIVIDEANDLLIVTRWLEPSQLGELVKRVEAAVR
ncbi:CubicO group peptidase, beta-lactamase class C family [Cnuella takakiae]|uniref:CubicO group peptidase, beta-lactamase class C family n=2 Tax=Cnuella takakiae TaxID=1302690 RepID=A0A1M5IAN3_9BACT|nr:CubicO group peptidase, beta-lactamase class C family [Cnuella takakiae]